MSDQLGREKPLRQGGTRSRTSKLARARRAQAADERAENRFAVVQAGMEKLRKPNVSLRESWRLLKQDCDAGHVTLHGLPPRSTYCKWMKAALEKLSKDEPITIQQFRDGPRTGRPPNPKTWHPLVREEFNQAMLSGIYPSIPLLHEHVAKWARANGLHAPSEDAVRRRYNATNIEELSAAYHGRRSARADQSAKLTVPVDYPHEIWTLDELDARNWVKAMHPVQGKLVPVRPKVIAIVENFSRPTLNLYACRPFKNGETTVSFDSEDVMGAYFGALFRELANDPYKQYVGFIPRVIRMDTASQHNVLKLFHRRVWGKRLQRPTSRLTRRGRGATWRSWSAASKTCAATYGATSATRFRVGSRRRFKSSSAPRQRRRHRVRGGGRSSRWMTS
jgi:hypothetical protein